MMMGPENIDGDNLVPAMLATCAQNAAKENQDAAAAAQSLAEDFAILQNGRRTIRASLLQRSSDFAASTKTASTSATRTNSCFWLDTCKATAATSSSVSTITGSSSTTSSAMPHSAERGKTLDELEGKGNMGRKSARGVTETWAHFMVGGINLKHAMNALVTAHSKITISSANKLVCTQCLAMRFQNRFITKPGHFNQQLQKTLLWNFGDCCRGRRIVFKVMSDPQFVHEVNTMMTRSRMPSLLSTGPESAGTGDNFAFMHMLALLTPSH